MSCTVFCFENSRTKRHSHSFPTRRSSDLLRAREDAVRSGRRVGARGGGHRRFGRNRHRTNRRCPPPRRSEEHTSELQSPYDLVCRLLLEKKKKSCLKFPAVVRRPSYLRSA